MTAVVIVLLLICGCQTYISWIDHKEIKRLENHMDHLKNESKSYLHLYFTEIERYDREIVKNKEMSELLDMYIERDFEDVKSESRRVRKKRKIYEE